ncbi:hypothetical protein LTR66_005379 [Elasticomyces elasticus]|nr:hypothetical protein LTR66_005379 [Elasticomyces elasticus]
MGKGGSLLSKASIATSGDFGSGCKPDDLKRWITNAGGEFNTRLTASTTHLICTQAVWQGQNATVQAALARKEIKVVSFDWLEDSLARKSKRSEKPYLWQNIDAAALKQRKTKEKAQAQAKKLAGKKVGGLVGEALAGHLDEYLGVKPAGRKAKRGLRDEEVDDGGVKRQGEWDECEEADVKRRKTESKKGGKEVVRDVLSEEHHVYMDATRFKYDIVLTKVDTRQNRNERYKLTIYESNALPHTYSTHLRFNGTRLLPRAETLVPLGSTHPVAYRSWRAEFEKRIGVPWDDRLLFLNPRLNSSTCHQSERDSPVAERTEEEEMARKQKEEADWKSAPFTYHVPQGTPRGVLNEQWTRKVKEEEERREVERLAKAGLLPIPEQSPAAAEEDAGTVVQQHADVASTDDWTYRGGTDGGGLFVSDTPQTELSFIGAADDLVMSGGLGDPDATPGAENETISQSHEAQQHPYILGNRSDNSERRGNPTDSNIVPTIEQQLPLPSADLSDPAVFDQYLEGLEAFVPDHFDTGMTFANEAVTESNSNFEEAFRADAEYATRPEECVRGGDEWITYGNGESILGDLAVPIGSLDGSGGADFTHIPPYRPLFGGDDAATGDHRTGSSGNEVGRC